MRIRTLSGGKRGRRSTTPVNVVTEIGVIISPAFQRTHVSTNAVGLLLVWTLDRPSAGGLGLRRVAWQAHAENQASREVALRMGFELEGILRWQRVSPTAVALPVEALEKRNSRKEGFRGYTARSFQLSEMNGMKAVEETWNDRAETLRKVISSWAHRFDAATPSWHFH
ncbi:hypothetical protein BGZ57DRAFT_614301 [Hyaloscypha finlandica]|nr:hypothetical protein BGZ57DRAFT_614301 [Hyaloscypha finlandica]